MASSDNPERQLDWLGFAALLISAFLLYWAQSSYHRYSYFQLLRWVVTLSALLGAWRFAAYRWYVATAALILAAVLFNPINPIRMTRYQWHPYDFWGALGCAGLAVLLVFASFRKRAAGL